MQRSPPAVTLSSVRRPNRSASTPGGDDRDDADRGAEQLDDQKAAGRLAVNRNTQDSGNTVTIWNKRETRQRRESADDDVAPFGRMVSRHRRGLEIA